MGGEWIARCGSRSDSLAPTANSVGRTRVSAPRRPYEREDPSTSTRPAPGRREVTGPGRTAGRGRPLAEIVRDDNRVCLSCHAEVRDPFAHGFGRYLAYRRSRGKQPCLHNQAIQSLGTENKWISHRGAKRGNPFSPQDDAHAAAGIQCTDCPVPEGHRIPRGRLGVDLVANDLPGREVFCQTCHTRAPHNNSHDDAPDSSALGSVVERLVAGQYRQVELFEAA